MTFPYTVKTGSLKDFIGKIQITNIPARVTSKHLESLGFKSTNDRAIISILKFISFLDSNGVPTDFYKNYRNTSKAKHVIAKAIKESYKPLFDVYPDAHRKDFETLRNFFSTHTSVGEKALKSTVFTFKALCGLGDFEGAGDVQISAEVKPLPQPAIQIPQGTQTNASGYGFNIPAVNIKIELQLPSTEDASIYDKLFASLKKHLLEK